MFGNPVIALVICFALLPFLTVGAIIWLAAMLNPPKHYTKDYDQ